MIRLYLACIIKALKLNCAQWYGSTTISLLNCDGKCFIYVLTVVATSTAPAAGDIKGALQLPTSRTFGVPACGARTTMAVPRSNECRKHQNQPRATHVLIIGFVSLSGCQVVPQWHWCVRRGTGTQIRLSNHVTTVINARYRGLNPGSFILTPQTILLCSGCTQQLSRWRCSKIRFIVQTRGLLLILC